MESRGMETRWRERKGMETKEVERSGLLTGFKLHSINPI